MDDGYDGVIYEHPTGKKEYVVFGSEQLKSAIGNKGTYDASGKLTE